MAHSTDERKQSSAMLSNTKSIQSSYFYFSFFICFIIRCRLSFVVDIVVVAAAIALISTYRIVITNAWSLAWHIGHRASNSFHLNELFFVFIFQLFSGYAQKAVNLNMTNKCITSCVHILTHAIVARYAKR